MKTFFPNPYLLATGVALLAYFLLLGIRILLSSRLERFSPRFARWDQIIGTYAAKTSHLFLGSSGLYIGFKYIDHSERAHRYADRIYFIIVMIQVAIWSHYLLDQWITSYFGKRIERNRAAASSIGLIQLLARMLLITFLILFTLSNLGIKITTLIAGLGVGGIAVALALQKILGDLFSSLSIVLDRPFVVGDFIVIDEFLGEVEKIGLKTTRLRSLSGEQIIFSNSDLLSARIRNYKRMHERRVPFILTLPLAASNEKIKTAVSLISAIIRTKKQVRFERCHFMRIGSLLEIETIYWVLSDDYNIHMDIQQEILFEIKSTFLSEGIDFAYPTTTVQVLPTEVFMKSEHTEMRSPSHKSGSLTS